MSFYSNLLYVVVITAVVVVVCTQFCATGTMGLSGNLSVGEILEQIIHADRILANEWNDRIQQHLDSPTTTDESQLPKLDLIRNVVFMGMGEVR